jgi:type IV secretory pathway VirB2 component (pilin)
MSTNSSIRRQAGNLKQEGKQVIRGAATSPLMEKLIRLGYIARGLVWAVIGILAFQVATGTGGKITDQQGAIAALGSTPLGQVLLYVMLVGLIGYALWGLIRAVIDPLHEGHDAKGIAQRVGYLVSGISYGLLALATYGLITAKASAARGGAQNAQTQQTTASVLTQPWGPWVVALVAVIIIGIGLLQVYTGFRRNFNPQFQLAGRTGSERKWIERLGRFGTVARGAVFTLIGVFLFQAAYYHDASHAQGIDGVLTALLHQPYGPWLLGIVAAGLIAFGIYSAMIRRVVRA